MQHQKRVKGGRIPTSTSVIRQLRAWVERQAREFNVSKSFVVAVAISKVSGIPIESYEVRETRRLRRVK